MKVPDEAVYEWDTMIRALEQSELFWEPGTQCGYHAATFGWLNGEVLRRITGMSVGEFIRKQIAGPLRADVFVGLSSQEQERTADTIPPSAFGNLIFRIVFALGGGIRSAAFRNPPRPPKVANTRRWREAEIPSSNGHASARGLARVYSVLALGGTANGVQLLSPAAVENAGREQVHRKDLVAGTPVRRTLGFMLPEPGEPRPSTAFGHPGMGGSLGFADPSKRLAMGYVMNKMIIGLDTRSNDLCRAIYSCLNP
jgi:CubicO group peptidase (beta-lactamase class C family)